MNNLFTTGLLAISIIALNGCKESIDLTSDTYRSSTSTTAATSNTENQETTSIIVTTAPVTVVKVIDITGEVSTETTTNSGTEESTSTNESGSSSSETEQTVDTVTTETSTTASCEVEASPITPFVRVQLHYGLMSGSPFVSGEVAGLDTLTVTEDAAQNATVLKLDSTIGLLPGQLITYVGSNGHNRVAKVGEVSQGQVTIVSGEGLETNITAGSIISNFYYDETHPNANGYKAVADFGLRSAYPIVPAQKHVLLGDSWFDRDEATGISDFQNQLETRLSDSTIINAGMGGNTLCDLINRFD